MHVGGAGGQRRKQEWSVWSEAVSKVTLVTSSVPNMERGIGRQEGWGKGTRLTTNSVPTHIALAQQGRHMYVGQTHGMSRPGLSCSPHSHDRQLTHRQRLHMFSLPTTRDCVMPPAGEIHSLRFLTGYRSHKQVNRPTWQINMHCAEPQSSNPVPRLLPPFPCGSMQYPVLCTPGGYQVMARHRMYTTQGVACGRTRLVVPLLCTRHCSSPSPQAARPAHHRGSAHPPCTCALCASGG